MNHYVKRKRTNDDSDSDEDSEKENMGSKSTQPPKKKQTKATEAPVKKRAKATVKTAGKAKTSAKEAKSLYRDTLKALDKQIDTLDKKVKAMSPNSSAITTANYASAAAKHMTAVKTLAHQDPALAFNLLLSLADASHTDLDFSFKMSGKQGDSSAPTFKKLDDVLLPLMEQRATPQQSISMDDLPEVPNRWTRKDAEVGEFKTGYPNAQQRNQMYRQKLEWEKERRVARRERREEVEDWVVVALNDLVEERDYLDQYGVRKYLPESIAKLEEIVAARA
jgi:hypothetical protein